MGLEVRPVAVHEDDAPGTASGAASRVPCRDPACPAWDDEPGNGGPAPRPARPAGARRRDNRGGGPWPSWRGPPAARLRDPAGGPPVPAGGAAQPGDRAADGASQLDRPGTA